MNHNSQANWTSPIIQETICEDRDLTTPHYQHSPNLEEQIELISLKPQLELHILSTKINSKLD